MVNLKSRSRAFTLIELLIVITIIGILAVALIPRLAGGPSRARDATRKSDLQQIATALEFYANDNNGGYPQATSSTTGAFCASSAFASGGGFPLTGYMSTIPTDPQSLATNTVIGTYGCSSGYAYIPVNTSTTTGTYAEGYVLAAMSESTTELATAGVYNGTGTYTPTVSGTTVSAATVIAGDTACTTTTACANGTARYYMVGH
jgi:prepilin-type N-terminal cleavage/methylation domain-containing protein